ncbi:MAG TPA: tyrosine--tRNA ligase, partial [Streptomyces sp.]|nr:tyrosine--tRNA ligase [Streptomyces sp.]
MTRLGDSVQRASQLLAQDLSSDETVEQLLAETGSRRYMDLSDLPAKEQAALIGARAAEVLPSVEKLAEEIEAKAAGGKGLHVKLGIDPTAADVHLGHAVQMIVLSRFQRMGHDVTLIIGDFTAKIGDPSGRTAERPALTDEDIAKNLAGYQDQVRPFFDFEKVSFRHNSDWLGRIGFAQLISLLAQAAVVTGLTVERELLKLRWEDVN